MYGAFPLTGRAAKLQGKLDAARGHLQVCSDPYKRQRIADNVAGLEQQLAQLPQLRSATVAQTHPGA